MAKFKIGDLIRIANELDPGFNYNHYYTVIKVQKKGYLLKSGQNGKLINQKRVKHLYINFGYKNMKNWLDDEYRLLTNAEIVLYVKKT